MPGAILVSSWKGFWSVSCDKFWTTVCCTRLHSWRVSSLHWPVAALIQSARQSARERHRKLTTFCQHYVSCSLIWQWHRHWSSIGIHKIHKIFKKWSNSVWSEGRVFYFSVQWKDKWISAVIFGNWFSLCNGPAKKTTLSRRKWLKKSIMNDNYQLKHANPQRIFIIVSSVLQPHFNYINNLTQWWHF